MKLTTIHMKMISSCLGWHNFSDETLDDDEGRKALYSDILDHYRNQCLTRGIDYIAPSIEVVVALCVQHLLHINYVRQANELGMVAWQRINETYDF